jgi:DNA-binding NarL/FixJ family response regulator
MAEIKVAILNPIIKARHELAELLASYGIKSIEAGNSSQLFSVIGPDSDIDLVIMETELYKENPFSIIIKLKKYIGAPIIIYTSNVSRKNYINSFVYGVCDFIVKPCYNDSEFMTRVLSYVKNYKNVKLNEYNVNMNIQEYMKYSYKMALRGGYPLNILISTLFVTTEKYIKEFDDEYYKLIPILSEEIKSKLSKTDFCFTFGSQIVISFVPFYDIEAINNIIGAIDNINIPTINIKIFNTAQELRSRIVTEYIRYPDEEKDWNRLLAELPKKINEKMKSESATAHEEKQL